MKQQQYLIPPVSNTSDDMKAGINFTEIRRKSLLKTSQKSRHQEITINQVPQAEDCGLGQGVDSDSEESLNHLKRLADTMKNRKSYMVGQKNQQ